VRVEAVCVEAVSHHFVHRCRLFHVCRVTLDTLLFFLVCLLHCAASCVFCGLLRCAASCVI
jgi:hypothetical protein